MYLGSTLPKYVSNRSPALEMGSPKLTNSALPPQINSLRTRNRAVAASTSAEWLSNYVVVQVSFSCPPCSGALAPTLCPSPQITPSGVRTLGYKFYIIWAVFNAVFVPTVYFFYFETSGRTLEDMDQVGSRSRRAALRSKDRC